MQKPKYLRVQDHPSLVKSTETGAILNLDFKAHEEYKRKKAIAADARRKRDAELNSMRDEISELRDIINKLIGR